MASRSWVPRPGQRGREQWVARMIVSEMREQPSWRQFTVPVLEPPEGVPVAGISNSEIATFKDCRRRWFLHYYLGYQGDEASVTSTSKLGTRVHTSLQGYYGHAMDPMTVIRAVYNREAALHPSAAADLTKEFEMAVSILEGYAEWLDETGADRGLVPVAAEMAVHYPVGMMHGWWVYLRSHLDVVMFNQLTGYYQFMDHKTVTSFDSANLLMINEQMKFYVMMQHLLSKSFGTRVDGGIFNMLKRSKRTAKASPPFYKREPVTYSDQDVISMWRRTMFTIGEILKVRNALNQMASTGEMEELQQSMLAPRPAPECSWKCPFLVQCPLMDDGSRWQEAVKGRYTQGDPYAYYGRGLLEDLATEGLI